MLIGRPTNYLALAPPPRQACGLARLTATVCLCFLASGCSIRTASGLIPLEPAVESRTRSIWTAFTPIDTLQPVLAWEPFEADSDAAAWRDPVEAVRYELRIWETRGGYEGRLVYSRRDLVSTRHQVKQPLAPATRHLWSVRAIYEVGGLRLTPWATSSSLVEDATVPNPA